MQWFGQAAFKITSVAGKVIVTDLWLITNLQTPEAFKKLESPGKFDLIFVTHGQFGRTADALALATLNEAPF